MRFDKAYFEAAFGTPKQLPISDLPEIAFSGRSNVGKSSLINKLINRKKLAKVSSTPGKTATINFYNVETARLVDLPGYGYAKVSNGEQRRWADLMEGYFTGERNINTVVQLVDMRHNATKQDIDMLRYMDEMQIPFVIVMTKSDKLNKTQTEKRLSALCDEFSFLSEMPQIIPISAVNGNGIEELKQYLYEKVLGE